MKMFRKYAKGILRSNRGEGLLSALYSMLLLTIVFFILLDIAGYTSTAWKLRNACSETLTLMKMENGMGSEVEEAFYRFITVQGLDTDKVSVSGTPPLVQRGDIVEIRASLPYVLKSVRPFNQTLEFNVEVEMSGLAQDFIRQVGR